MKRYHLIFLSFALTAACLDKHAGTVDTSTTDIAQPEVAPPDVAPPDVAEPDVAEPDVAPSDVAEDTAEVVEEPVEVDIVWVVDTTTSMCGEQAGLEHGFKAFADRLAGTAGLDARVAVTSTSAQCDVGEGVAPQGKFNQRAATGLPGSCVAQQAVDCTSDADCANLDCSAFESCDGPQDAWVCAAASSDECRVNENGSINTSCQRSCETDTECQTVFGDPAYTCASAPAGAKRCRRSLDTATCPTELPAFVDSDSLSLLPCIGALGLDSSQCSRAAAPLLAGFMALDPAGANATQAAAFLRPDAYLVVIFVSDADDCSIAADATIDPDNVATCALLETSANGGPLQVPGDLVAKFKGLKTDPAKVMVTAISGDSLATGADAKEAERTAYFASKAGTGACAKQTSICATSNGPTDFGSRLMDFTMGFGANGGFVNICSPDGLAAALTKVADDVVKLAE